MEDRLLAPFAVSIALSRSCRSGADRLRALVLADIVLGRLGLPFGGTDKSLAT
jgi:hypothetical protein